MTGARSAAGTGGTSGVRRLVLVVDLPWLDYVRHTVGGFGGLKRRLREAEGAAEPLADDDGGDPVVLLLAPSALTAA